MRDEDRKSPQLFGPSLRLPWHLRTSGTRICLLLFLVTGPLFVLSGGHLGDHLDQAVAADGDADRGKGLFGAACSGCHGPDASGIPQLGKNLRTSDFVRTSTPEAIQAFVQAGHGPTADFPGGMPPDGGTSYGPAELADIAAWLKSLSPEAK